MYWKDITIFIDFFKNGIKEDLKQLFNYFLNINTYKGFLYSIGKTARKSVLGSKNQMFMSMFIVVLATMTKQLYIIVLSVIFFFIMYGVYKWKTGDPLKFYKEKYFSSEIIKKFK